MSSANTLTERSLADRLGPRLAREKQFAATGRKLRHKSWLFRHEKIFIRPLLRGALRVSGLYGRGLRNAVSPVVTRLELTYSHLPEAFDGYTILHLSDLHVDGLPGLPAALRGILTKMEPDVCLITGDYRFEDEGPCEAVYPLMDEIIGSIRSRDGVYAILGNHDVSEIALTLNGMGLRMLVNEAVEIRRGNQAIWVAGLDDPFDYRCADLDGTLASVPSEAFAILMVHTPELYRDASEANAALYLCGHTHAGQIRFPFVGSIRHNCPCPKELAHGHWRHGHMHGYTSAGVGSSGVPVRYNCPPEVVLIRLRRG